MSPIHKICKYLDMVFVTRKYPPSVGGMERLAEVVFQVLNESAEARLIALRRSQRHLVWFLPWAFVRLGWLLLGGSVRHVVCADPLVLIALRPILALGTPRLTLFVHGRDLTFPNRAYRRLVRSALPTVDRVIAISEATAELAATLGARPERVAVVRPGLPVPVMSRQRRAEARAEALRKLALDDDSLVVLTVGRLIERKGVRWFIRSVLPALPPEVVYVVAGEGPEWPLIERAASEASHRVILLGRVDDATRDLLLSAAHLFVMPNIPIQGDMEGFGLTAIEAALQGTVVVGSRLEGIEAAVIDGHTGFLCRPLAAHEFASRISQLLEDRGRLADLGERFRRQAAVSYSAKRMARDLREALAITGPDDGGR